MFDLFLMCFLANVLSLVSVVILFAIMISIERKKRLKNTK